MSFWLGVAEGLNQQLDRNLKRELFLGEKREKVASSRRTYLKMAMDRRQEVLEQVQEQAAVLKNFEDRLEGVPYEDREAYLAILSSEPEYATSLWGRIQDLEEKEEIRLTDEDIIEYDDIISELKPQNMTKEEFMSHTIENAFDPSSRVAHYDNIRMRILSSTDEEEMLMEAMRPEPQGVNYGLGSISDPDPTTFQDPEPTDENQFRNIAEQELLGGLSTEWQRYQQEAEAAGLGETTSREQMDPAWVQRYDQLSNWIDMSEDSTMKDQLLPQLWEDPEFSSSMWGNIGETYPNQLPKFRTLTPSFLSTGQ